MIGKVPAAHPATFSLDTLLSFTHVNVYDYVRAREQVRADKHQHVTFEFARAEMFLRQAHVWQKGLESQACGHAVIAASCKTR